MKYEIDLANIKVTNAIASVINSAFETGINPAWFQVKSLNKGGFLDAAFADGEMDTPSGKPASTEWVVEYRMNCEGTKTPWVKVTPAVAVEKWTHYLATTKDKFLPTKVHAYLHYLDYMSQKDFDPVVLDNILFNDYEPDGVHDDAMAQIATSGEVMFG